MSDEKLSKLIGVLERIDERMTAMEAKLETMHSRLDSIEEVQNRSGKIAEEMYEHNWIMQSVGGMLSKPKNMINGVAHMISATPEE